MMELDLGKDLFSTPKTLSDDAQAYLGHLKSFYQNDDDRSASLPLNVAISGGGICGLATAVALARRGHNVTVYEAAPEIGTIGAGIQVAPNSTRQLYKWGLQDILKQRIVYPKHLTVRRWQDGRQLGVLKTRALESRFGSPFVQIHRGDLHEGLKSLAIQNGVVLRTNSRALDYDFAKPSMTLESGERVEADLIIAADGVRSTARAKVEKEAAPPHEAEFAAYRAVLETKDVRRYPELAWLVEDPHQNCWAGPDHHCQVYSMQGNTLFNLVFIAPLTSTRDTQEFKSELVEHFSGWDPTLERLVGMLDKVQKWPVWTAPHLKEWSKPASRFAIMGDAAHDMTPFLGQGSAMAVEDAALLAHVLSPLRSQTDIAPALEILQAHRIPRTHKIRQQALRNVAMWHMHDGEEQQRRDEASKAELSDEPLQQSPYIYADPHGQEWLYGYDVLKALYKQ